VDSPSNLHLLTSRLPVVKAVGGGQNVLRGDEGACARVQLDDLGKVVFFNPVVCVLAVVPDDHAARCADQEVDSVHSLVDTD